MTSKKILLVSRSFYPMNSPRSFRATELAKELAFQGHQVTVLTVKSAGLNDFAKLNGFKIRDLGKNKYKAIQLKGKGLELLAKRVIYRLSKLLFEYPDIQYYFKVKNTLKHEKGYDALISIAVPYPIHWGVAAIWNRKRKINPAKIWVADCGDPYMGTENDTFKKPFYFKYVEKWFCKKVDYITVPTPNSILGYYKEFHCKIKVIPQGFKFEDIKIKTLHNDRLKVKFAYAGGFIPGKRDPTEFCEYLIKKNIDYEFSIYSGNHQLTHKYKTLSQGKILCLDFVPREELLYKLGEVDFVVNFENVGEKQTPSKLIDYAIINKPILSIKTGNLQPHLIDEFLNKNYRNAYMVKNVDQYRIENVAKEFIKLIS